MDPVLFLQNLIVEYHLHEIQLRIKYKECQSIYMYL